MSVTIDSIANRQGALQFFESMRCAHSCQSRIAWLLALSLLATLFASCRPRLNSADPAERLRAVEAPECADQSILAAIAERDTDAHVRKAAVTKLTDQRHLAEVALGSTDSTVVSAAVNKLGDQTCLLKVALEGNSIVGRETLEKLVDQASMAEAALGAVDPDVRSTAVGRLFDQLLVAKVATQTDDAKLRSAAFAKLTDQTLLAKIVIVEKNADLRRAAVVKLTDQALLGKLATEDGDSTIRVDAVGMLTSQSLLAKVVAQTDDNFTRRWAFAKLTDQGFIGEIAVENKDPEIRQAAVEKLVDQELLAKIAIQPTEIDLVRIAAVARITDQSLLARIAAEVRDADVRRIAVKKLADQGLLAEIVVTDSDIDIHRIAVEKLENQTLLAKIAVEDADSESRRIAIERLQDQTLLAKIAVEDADSESRRIAVERLGDQTLLAKVTVRDKDYTVCAAAVARLSDEILLAQVVSAGNLVNPHIRSTAIEKLGKAGSVSAIETLISALYDDDTGVSRAASCSLSCIGKPAIEPLLRHLEDKRESDSDRIRLTLASCGHEESLAWLLAEFRDYSVQSWYKHHLVQRIGSAQLLSKIETAATDGAIRIAARVQRLSPAEWDLAIKEATENPFLLKDTLAAISFSPERDQLQSKVGQICLSYIRRGETRFIPQLRWLLDEYGSIWIGNLYLNCGQPEIGAIARQWALQHAFTIDSTSRSPDATWGSGR